MGKLALSGGNPVRTRPFPTWPEVDTEDEQGVLQVVRNGKWWQYAYGAGELAGDAAEGGSRVEEFERAFAQFQHARHALAVASGSGALEICCRAVGLEPGDEVITTPYTFIASASCVLNAGAVPVFVDVEPDTYNLDPDRIEAAITPRTKAILPVHFGGQIADMTRIRAIAQKHHLKIIEDAAQAPGASLTGGRWAGTLGDCGIFSLQQSKLLTCGEGGIFTTNDDELADQCWSLRHYGRARGGQWYEHVRLGWHYRMTELQGALLLSQLKKLPEQNARRARNTAALFQAIEHVPGLSLCRPNREADRQVFYLVVLRYDQSAWDGVPRDKLIAALKAEGIPCLSGYTWPLYENPMFREHGYARYRGQCPVAEHACRQEAIWLTQPLLLGTEEDTRDIARAIGKVYEHRSELRVL